MQLELTELTKQNQLLVKQKAQGLKGQLKAEVVSINGVNFLATHIDLDAASQKDLAFELGQDIKDLFLIFASQEPNKALLTCYVSKNLVSDRGLNAATIVRELGRFIQGGGGGQPFFATAGGKQPQGLDQALEAAREYLK